MMPFKNTATNRCVFWALHGVASSPPQAAKRSKNFVPSLEYITLEGAGHWLMVERKDDVTKEVGDWIDKNLKAEGRTMGKL
jgi:pimeloyl-ACP methyl ester carboxylesterase